MRWAIHHLLSTSCSCWKSITAKPAKESWQVWYWAIKVWCSYLDFSNSIPIPHPLTQNYQPDIKISRDIQPLLHFAVSSNILLTTSILLCHTLWQFCRFISQHQTYCRFYKKKKSATLDVWPFQIGLSLFDFKQLLIDNGTIVHWIALNEVDCCVSNHNFRFILIR